MGGGGVQVAGGGPAAGLRGRWIPSRASKRPTIELENAASRWLRAE
jgi:hypothetical protein